MLAPFKTSSTRRPSSNAASASDYVASAIPQEQIPEQLPRTDFSARRSGRVATGQFEADNDTWVEALAVCEVAKDNNKKPTTTPKGGLLKKLKSKSSMGSSENLASMQQQEDAEMAMAAQRLTLRPYFQSRNTGQRVWDEPPSGASNIVYATAEARKMAQAQLEEMRSTYAHAAMLRRSEKEEEAALEKNVAGADKTSGKRLALPKIFKRTSSSMSETEGQSTPLVASSNNDAPGRSASARTGIPASILEESINFASESTYEQDLQMAMMLSMGIGKGSVMGVGDHPNASESDPYSHEFASSNNCTPAAAKRLEREQIAMAKALSLAEENARRAPLDDCRKQKSGKTKNKSSHYSSLENEDTTDDVLSEQLVENAASPPTMCQIEADFGIS